MRHGSVGQPGTSWYRDPDGDEPPVHDNVSQAFALDVAPSMPRGWIRPVPMAALRARAARLCLRGLWCLPAGSLVLRWVDAAEGRGRVCGDWTRCGHATGCVETNGCGSWGQGGLACWRCRSCCRAARCLVVDGPRSEAHDRSAQDNHNDQATVATSSKPKTATATTLALLKTGDSNWITATFTLLFPGIVFLGAAYYC